MTTTTQNASVGDNATSAPPASSLNTALLLVRVIVGVILMAHGAQKLFGWFDGPGLQTVMGKFPAGPVFAVLVAIGEFFGGLGLAVGFLSRFSALANIVIMLGAIVLAHGSNGFFLANKGYEFNLALIGLLIPTALTGPGLYTIPNLLGLRLPRFMQ